MPHDDAIILALTRENESLRRKNNELQTDMDKAERMMRAAGIPGGFEDGNSYDDYSFLEQIKMLCQKPK